MHDFILQELKRIEAKHRCIVLYACESGSRAWGFASPDSDYDLRFIYTHDISWHLHLEPRRDTIEEMAPNDLDLSGWELLKMLRLFAGCNLALNEWLDSPEIYLHDQEFLAQMRDLIPQYFNPKKALHHYISMADNTQAQHLEGYDIKVKKAFYILRPLLASTWIAKYNSMPPTRFDRLINEQPIPVRPKEEIQTLLLQKLHAKENHSIKLAPVLASWITQTLQDVKDDAPNVPVTPDHSMAPLNAIALQFIPGNLP
jgi:predicted nucleotidyltransferase